jgi:hypothetical protein
MTVEQNKFQVNISFVFTTKLTLLNPTEVKRGTTRPQRSHSPRQPSDSLDKRGRIRFVELIRRSLSFGSTEEIKRKKGFTDR